ncbi:MAG: amidohydrolase family protein, partial [Pseudomonadota bacterium]
DLEPQLAPLGVEKTMLIQAAATVHETEYMLGLADATPSIAGVVGWIDFEDPGQATTLDRLSQHPAFKGVRPMIQDIPDDDWMLRDDVQWAYQALADRDLTFDALGFPRHLANFLTIFTRYPELRCVVDHCMKPDIHGHSDASFAFWADGMRRIARETGAYCKLSGLTSEASPEWRLEDLKPYAHHVIDVFGPDRVMWGSDWPVVRLRAEYPRWRDAAEALTADLSPEQRAQIFGGTAAAFYGIAT